MGQFSTRRPVGTDGMFSTSDSDQPTADGPVGRFITHSPVGPDHCMTSDSDQPTADGPVGRFRMFSPYELNQPVTVGPEDQLVTSGAPMRGNLTVNGRIKYLRAQWA